MIKIRWQSTNSPGFAQAHGSDFKDDLELWHGMTWKEYVVVLAEQRKSCLRIWVNDITVWDYDHSWYSEWESMK